MSKLSKLIYFISAILFFVFLDMYFSEFLLNHINIIPQNSFLELLFVQNSGAAFSLLQDARTFLIYFSIAAIIIVMYYTYRNIQKYSTFFVFWVALLVSGIFCNMYERIAFGYVRDFFKLNFIDFPVFNISDVFINISVIALVVIIIKHNFSKTNEADN